MKKISLILVLHLFVSAFYTDGISQNQVGVGIGIALPDPSAILDVSSVNKGVLVPRMTTNQINTIPSATNGLLVYNTDSNCFNYYKNNAWVSFCDEIRNATNAAMPCGAIIMWGGNINQIPTGWYLCDGSLGTPNLADRFIMGSVNNLDINTTGGSNQITLTSNQLPSHNHTGNTNPDGDHAHNFSGTTDNDGAHEHSFWAGNGNRGGGFDKGEQDDERNYHHPNNSNVSRHRHNFSGVTNSNGVHAHPFTTDNTGIGEAIDIRPSYYKLAYIRKCLP